MRARRRAYWLLGETLTAANIIGIAVIIVAVCVFTARDAKARAAAG